MNVIDAVAASAGLQILGWTLAHAVWQGAVVALLLALLLRAFRHTSSELRYGLSCLALAITCALPITTAWSIGRDWSEHQACWRTATAGVHAISRECMSHGMVPIHQVEEAGKTVQPDPLYVRSLGVTRPLAWVAALWIAGVLFLLVRTTLVWRRAARLRTRGTAPLRGELADSLLLAMHRVGITRPVALISSTVVDVPMVVGWRRPVVLFPRAVLERLSLPELEAVLAHELAHVRRNDFAVNLLQTVADALLFFHPAARWISRRIREEREFCCDELAVRSIPGSLPNYLRALVAIDTLRPVATHGHAIAITGGALLLRARRLAAGSGALPRARPHCAALALLLGGTVFWTPAVELGAATSLSAWTVMTLDLEQRRAFAPGEPPERRSAPARVSEPSRR